MQIEAYIVKRVNLLMNSTDAKIVKRLEGGMSNYTYVVECEGKQYTGDKRLCGSDGSKREGSFL